MNGEAWSLGGTVLAGGESRRMGRDKAMLAWNGEPLWMRQKQVLLESGAQPVTVVRKRGQPPLGGNVQLLYDTVDGAGPLAGLHAALLACQTHLLAVLAVDLPRIDPSWFRWLSSFCRPGVGAVACISAGFEPLAAIYPREALATVTSHLRLDNRSLQHMVSALVQVHRLVAVPLPESERCHLLNWNTPDDIRADSRKN
jgi:molybdopterin-guanine dinucleotide biosynthesis protein A